MIYDKLGDFLLLENKYIISMGDTINNEYILPLIPLVMLIALGIEFVTTMNFGEVVKQVFFVFLVIVFFKSFYTQTVQESFHYANTLIEKQNSNNLIRVMSEAKNRSKKEGKEGGLTDSLKSMLNIDEVIDHIVLFLMWLYTRFSLYIIKHLYSLVYNFTYAFSGVAALLSVLPFTRKSLGGLFKSVIFCILMPWVVALVLVLCGNILTEFSTSGTSIINSADGLIQLALIATFIFASPVITMRLMSGSGIAQVAESIGNMGAMASIMSVPMFMKNSLKKHAPSGLVHAATAGAKGMKLFGGKGAQIATTTKDYLGSKVHSGENGKNLSDFMDKNDLSSDESKTVSLSGHNANSDQTSSGISNSTKGQLKTDSIAKKADGVLNKSTNQQTDRISKALAYESTDLSKRVGGTPLESGLPHSFNGKDLSSYGSVATDSKNFKVDPLSVVTRANLGEKAMSQVGQIPNMKENIFSTNKQDWSLLTSKQQSSARSKFGFKGDPAFNRVYVASDPNLRGKSIPKKEFLKDPLKFEKSFVKRPINMAFDDRRPNV